MTTTKNTTKATTKTTTKTALEMLPEIPALLEEIHAKATAELEDIRKANPGEPFKGSTQRDIAEAMIDAKKAVTPDLAQIVRSNGMKL